MFSIGLLEIIVVLVVALVVLKPTDWPILLYKAGHFFKKIRIISHHFQRSIEQIMTEAELDDLKKTAELKSKSSHKINPPPL